MNNPDDICKDCGLARREHHHDGGAYGLCGQFSEIAHSSNPRRIMNEREELLACPFCGGKPNLETYSMGSAAISCEECLVMSPMGADANMATRLWNRRCGLAQRRPMRADIAQIIDRGWKAGKSSNDVAEEILREFDPSPVSSTERKPGFFANLTPEQQTSALEYDGPENHGDAALSSTNGDGAAK